MSMMHRRPGPRRPHQPAKPSKPAPALPLSALLAACPELRRPSPRSEASAATPTPRSGACQAPAVPGSGASAAAPTPRSGACQAPATPRKTPEAALPREFWKGLDAQHAARPDYLLWRVLASGGPTPAGLREDAAALTLRALRAPEWVMAAAAVELLPGLRLEKLPPARRAELAAAVAKLRARPGQELAFWLARSVLAEKGAAQAGEMLARLADALAFPQGKPGRVEIATLSPASESVRALRPSEASTSEAPAVPESPAPLVPAAKKARWLAGEVQAWARAAGMQEPSLPQAPHLLEWHLCAWMLLRDARPPHAPVRPEEVAALLDAVGAARAAGAAAEAARLAALALHLLPHRAPEPLRQRAQVAAWAVAEAGLAVPEELRVCLEELPFPGENPDSPKGQEVEALFHDAADVALHRLREAAAVEAEWAALREAGVALRHPLAALAWVARKAQAHQVKKQHALLEAAAHLAERQHALHSLGKICAQHPGTPGQVLALARAMRAGLRQMPYLRDAAAWARQTAHLRMAWGRLEADALQDAEEIFFLHETLLDREVTTLRRLGTASRLSALRHLHSRKRPSPHVLELAAEPKLLRQLEHQRRSELWELPALLRERAPLAGSVWISLVSLGEPGSGRYSLLVQGQHERRHIMGRLRPAAEGGVDAASVLEPLAEAVRAVAPEAGVAFVAAEELWAGLDWHALWHSAGLELRTALLPSWEWAFRVLREAVEQPPAPVILLPENAPPPEATPTFPPLPELAHACLLLPGAVPVDAATRWLRLPLAAEEKPLRSLALGAHPLVLSLTPLSHGALRQDLARLCLAQATRRLLAPQRALSAEEVAHALRISMQEGAPLPVEERLHAQMPGLFSLHGLPRGCEL